MLSIVLVLLASSTALGLAQTPPVASPTNRTDANIAKYMNIINKDLQFDVYGQNGTMIAKCGKECAYNINQQCAARVSKKKLDGSAAKDALRECVCQEKNVKKVESCAAGPTFCKEKGYASLVGGEYRSFLFLGPKCLGVKQVNGTVKGQTPQ